MISGKAKHIRAAETALGVEPLGTETQKESHLRRRWESFLAPLGLALPEEYPPQDMWYRIQASLDRAEDRKVIKQTKQGLSRWRLATLGASAVAAGLAAFRSRCGHGCGAPDWCRGRGWARPSDVALGP